MIIKLRKAKRDDAQKLIEMQIESFSPLYEKYHDDKTSPAKEDINDILTRMAQKTTVYYEIVGDDEIVGGIRIRELDNKRYRISPIYILPRFQGKGIAQEVFRLIEEMYSDSKVWELDTILQEAGNCHLYEKLGYIRTGKEEIINNKMTIIFYEKNVECENN